jgi:hypothetical protein
MAGKTDTEWFVASESFVSQEGMAYHKNITRVRKGDKMLKAAPDLFKPIEESYGGVADVEAATAGPGEKRAVAKPRKKRVAKPKAKPTPAPEPEPEPEPAPEAKPTVAAGMTLESMKGN